jgi:hypothetical protein
MLRISTRIQGDRHGNDWQIRAHEVARSIPFGRDLKAHKPVTRYGQKVAGALSDVAPNYKRVKLDGKLTTFEPVLYEALTKIAIAPSRDGAVVVCCLLKCGLKAAVAPTAPSPTTSGAGGKSTASPAKAFVPMRYEFGKAFQFDWGGEVMAVGGVFSNV